MRSKRKRKTSKRGPGRPPGPRTKRTVALLYEAQKRDLNFLSEHMEGQPTVTGLIREAVTAYVAEKLAQPNLREAYEQVEMKHLRVVRGGGAP